LVPLCIVVVVTLYQSCFFRLEQTNIIQAPKPLSGRESWRERKQKKKQTRGSTADPKEAASHGQTAATREPEKTRLPAGWLIKQQTETQ